MRHVEYPDPILSEDLASKIERKLIKRRWNRRVRREHSLAPHGFNVLEGGISQIWPADAFLQQRERE